MLDERKAAILRAVVQEYIETAQPVGSSHVTRAGEVQVSSATVRNEMAVLEREGYLAQPHTSAGRIPTDKGYRFFVDQLVAPGALEPGQRQRVRDFFNRTHGEIEQMLHDTSQLLSGLTDYAAVVVGPPHEVAVIRSAQLVGLGPRVALLVLVLSNGTVEKHSVELAADAGEERVNAAGARLAGHLVGTAVAEVGAVPPSGDAVVDSIVDHATAAIGASRSDDADQVFVGGASRMASAFDAVETVRGVLSILEQQYVVVTLLRDVLDSGLTVAIGTEHGVVPLAECSVVVANYDVDGEHSGTIGVLGPTRMNYPQALAAVAVVSQRLSQRLVEGYAPVDQNTDFYELLGVAHSATEDEIKKAYRQLARELHPDVNDGNPANEERFKEVTVAYETLRDPERRRRYDMYGIEGLRGMGGAGGGGEGDPFAGFGAGLGDIFEAFFNNAGFGGAGFGGGGGRGGRVTFRGADLELAVELDFEEAVFGAKHDVQVRAPTTCETCGGSGARPGTSPVTCTNCGGSGEVRRVRQSILGQMVTASPCTACGGTGEQIPTPCADCRGDGRRTEEHTYSVDIPAGVDDGTTLRLTGRGGAAPRGGPAGDLYVHLRVRPHERFERVGNDLVHVLHVSTAQAALGTHLDFATLDGDEQLVVPAGTHTGRELRLRGRGVPAVRGRGRGDLIVQVVVDTPTDLTSEQEALVRRLAELRGEHVNAPEAGLMSKIRSAFK